MLFLCDVPANEALAQVQAGTVNSNAVANLKPCRRRHSSYRTVARHAVTGSKGCVNQEFYNSFTVRQPIRNENYQLNDVRFTICCDGGRNEELLICSSARMDQLKLYSTRVKGGETPAMCDLHGNRAETDAGLSPACPLSLSPQTLNTRDSVMEINALRHGNKFNKHTHPHTHTQRT